VAKLEELVDAARAADVAAWVDAWEDYCDELKKTKEKQNDLL
jgi:hypothetical protein